MVKPKAFKDLVVLFVKLEREELNKIDSMAKEDGYSNRSECVRMVLRDAYKRQKYGKWR